MGNNDSVSIHQVHCSLRKQISKPKTLQGAVCSRSQPPAAGRVGSTRSRFMGQRFQFQVEQGASLLVARRVLVTSSDAPCY